MDPVTVMLLGAAVFVALANQRAPDGNADAPTPKPTPKPAPRVADERDNADVIDAPGVGGRLLSRGVIADRGPVDRAQVGRPGWTSLPPPLDLDAPEPEPYDEDDVLGVLAVLYQEAQDNGDFYNLGITNGRAIRALRKASDLLVQAQTAWNDDNESRHDRLSNRAAILMTKAFRLQYGPTAVDREQARRLQCIGYSLAAAAIGGSISMGGVGIEGGDAEGIGVCQ